jgi:hypothetical protein
MSLLVGAVANAFGLGDAADTAESPREIGMTAATRRETCHRITEKRVRGELQARCPEAGPHSMTLFPERTYREPSWPPRQKFRPGLQGKRKVDGE